MFEFLRKYVNRLLQIPMSTEAIYEARIKQRMGEIAAKYNLPYLEWHYIRQDETEKSNFFDYEFAQSGRHQYDYEIPAHKWMRRPYIDFHKRHICTFQEKEAIVWINDIELVSPAFVHAPYNKYFCQIVDWFPVTDAELDITDSKSEYESPESWRATRQAQVTEVWTQTNRKFNYSISTIFPVIIPVQNTSAAIGSPEYVLEHEYIRLSMLIDALVLSLDSLMGSGSTGKACVLEGFNFIGIERDEAYYQIARSRILQAKKGKGQ